MRIVLINYEIKKSNIIKKNYITKKLVNYTKDIKKININGNELINSVNNNNINDEKEKRI